MNDDKMARRFYLLNFAVTIVLLIAIFVSIHQFGGENWHEQKPVAVILPGEKSQVGWNKTQYLAAKSVCEEFDYNLILRENVFSDFDSCHKVVEELSQRGVNNIFFVNGLHLYDLREFEKLYPKITFTTIESISVLWGGGSHSILAFEGSYLAGILAGFHTKTNKIGYIAPYSDSEVNQNINAFALGVKRVNPDAEILLNWTGGWNNPSSEEQAVQNLKARRVDVLCYHQNGDTVPKTAERAGIYFIGFNETNPNSNYFLATVKIDWQQIHGNLMRHSANALDNEHYTFGMTTHTVDFITSDRISTREKVAVEEAKWEINNGRIIFTGDIFDTNDVKRCSANEAISFQSLHRNMNWLIKGVRIVGT